MSWYANSWGHMEDVRRANAGKEPAEIAKAIDQSYPYQMRKGWAYKAWLEARKDFFRQHNLPRPRARKPEPGLFGDKEAARG